MGLFDFFKRKAAPQEKKADKTPQRKYVETVFVVKGGRVYHSVPMCFNSDDFQEITLQQAKKKGLTPCKKCYKV